MVVGTVGGMEAVSNNTFDFLCKLLLCVITVSILIQERKKFLKSYTVTFFPCYWLMVLSITTLTNFGEGVSYYYFLLPCFISYLVALISDNAQQAKRTFTLACLVMVMSATNFLVYYYPYMWSQRNAEVDSLVSFLDENNIHHIIVPFWQAGPIEAYSEGRITTAFMSPYSKNEIEPFVYLNVRDNYYNVPIAVLTDDEEAKILANENSKLHSKRNAKIGEVGSYNIYKFESTPFFLKWLPDTGETIEHKMENLNLINGAYIDDEGNVLSNGSEGYFVTGPYIAVEDGRYDISFFYSIIDKTESNMIGHVDVSYYFSIKRFH